ncbi:MAG: hypothetical protein M3M95_00800 [Pseudomonadota bacterium]|nr:hypothetical protein [Pseudomonadota bacterium]
MKGLLVAAAGLALLAPAAALADGYYGHRPHPGFHGKRFGHHPGFGNQVFIHPGFHSRVIIHPGFQHQPRFVHRRFGHSQGFGYGQGYGYGRGGW